MALITSPVGQLTSIGVGKENTFGVFATPTIFHGAEAFSPTSKNIYIPKPGSKRRPGMSAPSTGAFEVGMTFRPESTPDTVGQMIAYAMGSQATPVATGGSSIAKTSHLSFGSISTLPSFSIEFNRVVDAIDFLGCCVDTMKLSLDVGKGLSADFTCVADTESIQPSPTMPTYTNTELLTMEAPATASMFNGVSLGASPGAIMLQKWDVTLANQLDKNYRGAGTGRTVNYFPLGQRKVTGSATVTFENNSIYKLFWGGNTGPNQIVAGVPLSFIVGSSSYLDQAKGLYYQIGIYMPNCKLEGGAIADKASGVLTQAITWSAYESSAGAGDDLNIDLQNSATTVY